MVSISPSNLLPTACDTHMHAMSEMTIQRRQRAKLLKVCHITDIAQILLVLQRGCQLQAI